MQSAEQRMQNTEEKPYELSERLVEFTIRLIKLVERIPNTRTDNHIAGQLLRCGTSPGPNYSEAKSAESRNDFIHKMRIALKELRETLFWLTVLHRIMSQKLGPELLWLINETDELISIFVSSINTADKNNRMYHKQKRTAGSAI
jgi:four helix bundle protein